MSISAAIDSDQTGAPLQTFDNVSWERALALIHRLDGRHTTEVLFQRGETSLSVAGGKGQYFVSVFTADERSFILTRPGRESADKVRLVVGGQSVSLPTCRVVDLPSAVDAAQTFFTEAEFSAGPNWVEQ